MVARMSPSIPTCQGRNAIESAAVRRPHHIQMRAAPGPEQQPAADGEPVEEREQHGRRAHVAADQRQPEDRADHEDTAIMTATTTSGSSARCGGRQAKNRPIGMPITSGSRST